MDYLPLRPAFSKVLQVSSLLVVLFAFMSPAFRMAKLEWTLTCLACSLALISHQTNWVLKADSRKATLVPGILLFGFFIPKGTLPLKQNLLLIITQETNKHYTLYLQLEGNKPLMVDSRPTLDKAKVRYTEIEKGLDLLLQPAV